MVNYPTNERQYVQLSYRYLRLALVVLVATLAVSLGIEIATGAGLLTSISAYYYTPVHSIFVGMLITAGVSLVALKGRDTIEDMFFNIAGALAFIVALVPTPLCKDLPADKECVVASARFLLDPGDLIRNNLPALFFGLLLTVGVGYIDLRKRKLRITLRPENLATWVTGGSIFVFAAAGLLWWVLDSPSFIDEAHVPAAIAMFVFIGCAVLINTGWLRGWLDGLYERFGEDDRRLPSEGYRTAYQIVLVGMVVGALASVGLWKLGVEEWVFYLEAIEILLFGTFWVIQTFDGWKEGTTCPLHDHKDAAADR